MQTLRQQEEAARKKQQQAAFRQAQLHRVAGITQSSSWKDYMAYLEEHRVALLKTLEQTDQVDPYQLGKMRGKLELLRELLDFEKHIGQQVSMLTQQATKFADEAKRKADFTLRPSTGAGQ